MAEISAASTIKIMITTDNHLGFMERDPWQKDDSFVTFEECLIAARTEHDVDMMILGGDLFHENKPSLGSLTRTISLFRKYVLGDRDVALTLVSDPVRNFPTHPLPIANFQDPNINVALPTFIVHGNHDDPVGGTSAIDVLSSSGLINYFGHVTNLDDVEVRPVLLRKGGTRLALYGLGNVRDDRLHRCFKLGKVRFVRPKENNEQWFSILVVHQNRGVKGGPMNKCGIPEDMLAPYKFDLIIWGNEHEQRIVPEPIVGSTTEIIQPGSTVMTSLSAAESNQKMYGILSVCGTNYKVEPYALQSIRPVVRRHITLSRERGVEKTLESVNDFLTSVAEGMLEEAEKQISALPDRVLAVHPHLKYPLMRLAVDFTDPSGSNYPMPNANRFGQQYMDVIANPGEMLKAVKPPPAPRALVAGQGAGADAPSFVYPQHQQISNTDIRSKIAEVFQQNAKDACLMLSEPEVSHAVYSFVEKSETSAIEEKIASLLEGCRRFIWSDLKKAKMQDQGIEPSRIQELAVEKKQQVNKEFAETHHGGDPLLGNGADVAGGILQMLEENADAVASHRTKPPVGAPIPKAGEVEEDGLPQGLAVTTRPLTHLGDDDDDDDLPPAQHVRGAAPRAPAPAANGPKVGTKRGRRVEELVEAANGDNDDEVVEMLPARLAKAPRKDSGPKSKGKAPVPPPVGPTLNLAPSAPLPPSAAAAAAMLSKWR